MRSTGGRQKLWIHQKILRKEALSEDRIAVGHRSFSCQVAAKTVQVFCLSTILTVHILLTLNYLAHVHVCAM